MVSESVVMGETDNIGQPTIVYNKQLKRDLSYPRSLVLPWDEYDFHHIFIMIFVFFNLLLCKKKFVLDRILCIYPGKKR